MHYNGAIVRNVLLLLLILLCFCCSSQKSIVVGSKNFSEQVLLGELLAQQIEDTLHMTVERKLNLGGTFLCHKALLSGDIDLYVEYTGTALTAILKEQPMNDPQAVFEKVQNAYQKKFAAQWLNPLGFNNTFAIIIRGEDARQLGVKTISDSAQYTPKWKAGFGYEFMERKDGFPGLSSAYGLKFSEPPRVMDLTLTYKAVAAKQVDFIAGNSTDGLISKLDLVVLRDDKRYFPPYEAAPVVRNETLKRVPALKDCLDALSGSINDDQMRKMNYEVDGEHRSVADVAREFRQHLTQRKTQ
jgi:osmoprotectant transport system substrate-binding protein